jgi:4-amino-4-deoxy-L-arabinose transferase-like glycosyltransferase
MWTALACYWAGRRWVSPKAGLLAAALFLSAPIVGWEATIAYVDLAATLYVALSVFAFLIWLEERSARDSGNAWLVLAGIMAGFACGVKYTMIATTGLLVLWAVGCVMAKKAGVTWKHVGILTGVAALVACPWYIRTWIWTGNPVYPFAYSLFGGKWWSAQAAVDYVREQSRFGIGNTLYAFWVAPWSTTFFAQFYANPPAKFTGALVPSPPANTFAAVFGSLGLGVIGLLPLWLLKPGVSRADEARKGNGALPAMVLYSAAFFVVWFSLTHQTRYLMVLLPLLLVPAVAGARAFWHAGRGWRLGVGAFCAVALLWGILPLYVLVQPAFAVAWGGESADTYLTRREPVYVLSKRINQTLPKDAKLLMLQETRGYYLDRPYQWGNPSQNALIAWDTFTTPRQMDAALRAQGITHVLVNWGATPPEIDREHWPPLARAAIDRGLWTTVFQTGGYGVYRIEGKP